MTLSQKLVLLGFLVATLFLSVVSNVGAAEGDHSAGVIVGQVWPSGDIGEGMEGSVAPGLFYEYAASEVFSVFAEGLRSSHTNKSLKIATYSVGIKSVLIYLDKLAPYALLGMGLYDVEKVYGSETAGKTLFGFNLGLGADLDLNERAFVGMAFQLHNIFSGSVDLPVRGRTELSGRWTGLFLRGGFRF